MGNTMLSNHHSFYIKGDKKGLGYFRMLSSVWVMKLLNYVIGGRQKASFFLERGIKWTCSCCVRRSPLFDISVEFVCGLSENKEQVKIYL